jgi:hypothetical protein
LRLRCGNVIRFAEQLALTIKPPEFHVGCRSRSARLTAGEQNFSGGDWMNSFSMFIINDAASVKEKKTNVA